MSTSKFGIPRWLLKRVASEGEIKELEDLIKRFQTYSTWRDRMRISESKNRFIARYIETFDHGIYKIRCKISIDDGVMFCEVGPWGLTDQRSWDRNKLPKKGDIVTWFNRGFDMPNHTLNYFMDSRGNIFRTNKSGQLKFSKVKDV